MSDKGDKKSLYRKTLKIMEQNMKNFLDQVEDTSPEPKFVADFDFHDFWTDVRKISEKLCFEANKLSISWLSPPLPSNSDLASMGSCLELACVSLIAAYHSFPSDAGLAIRVALKDSVKRLLESCHCFIKTMSETLGRKFSSNNHPILQSFGQLSNSCETVKKLPTNNKAICSIKLLSQYDILKDALSEIEGVKSDTFLDDFGDSVEQWTETDHNIINPSLGMIKTSIVLVKKTSDTIRKSGMETTSSQFLDYDKILERIKNFSALVDDLALTLYPPLNWNECKQSNQVLKDALEEGLNCLADLHFMQSEDANKWREFIGKAVIHNFSEIQRVFITKGMAEIKVGDDN